MNKPPELFPQISRPRESPEEPNWIIETLSTIYVIASMPALWYAAPRAIEWITDMIRRLL